MPDRSCCRVLVQGGDARAHQRLAPSQGAMPVRAGGARSQVLVQIQINLMR